MSDYLAKVEAVRNRIAKIQRAYDLQQRVMRLDTVVNRLVDLVTALGPEELGKYQISYGVQTAMAVEQLVGEAMRVLTEPAYKVDWKCGPWAAFDLSVGSSKENESARSYYEEWVDPDL